MQFESRTWKVCRPKTEVLPLCHLVGTLHYCNCVFLVQHITRCKEVIEKDDQQRREFGLTTPSLEDFKQMHGLKPKKEFMFNRFLVTLGLAEYKELPGRPIAVMAGGSQGKDKPAQFGGKRGRARARNRFRVRGGRGGVVRGGGRGGVVRGAGGGIGRGAFHESRDYRAPPSRRQRYCCSRMVTVNWGGEMHAIRPTVGELKHYFTRLVFLITQLGIWCYDTLGQLNQINSILQQVMQI